MVPSANKPSLLDLSQLPEKQRYFIAYSGGVDSTALLHALYHHPDIDNTKLIAIHINHNIHENAATWAEHCKTVCLDHDIEFICKNVFPKDHSENACRQARLRVFADELTAHDCLLTGHHLNDQVETVLFRLLRGTGLNGLNGMAMLSKQAHYQVYRPMLNVDRSTIETYITNHQLTHVNDPSNQQNHYSRNYLRNQVLPLIEEHYPNAVQNIHLTSQNLRNTTHVLNELLGNQNPLDTSRIKDPDTLASVLYHWLATFDVVPANHHALQQFSQDCLQAQHDKLPELVMPEWQLNFWQDNVYLLKHLPDFKPSTKFLTIKANQLQQLTEGFGAILIKSECEFSINVMIDFQRNQEKIKLSQHQSRQKVKNLFQNKQIPPWHRAIMPFVYIEGELMAVGTEFLAENFLMLLKQHKAEYQWLSPQYLL